MAKRRMIPQPPIDRHARPTEVRLIWVGIALIILACLCIVAGAMATHTIKEEGVGPEPLTEFRLNFAASRGGVKMLLEAEAAGGDAPPCPT